MKLADELPVAQLKAELFKSLGHPVRVQVLEQLVEGERSVGGLADALGIELSALSQQLGVLRRAGVVVTRRAGNTIHYSLRDPGMVELLAVAKRMLVANLQDSRALLHTMENDAGMRSR
ncbi:ArsR/SmtB family transcription factor [Glaciibacter superstes]|uniref:ArsR/SmtB family transcription factor n=1 Tax=Glaciibacter superstes TaxID=501023 RepID=UPI0003B40F83|nr:metalloregulator ArsR/SmtB family transcription factor [Glaciibacter superstes]